MTNPYDAQGITSGGASGVGFGAAMWGLEPLMWGSEFSFANNGVRRSEMWGSWPPSPPTLSGAALPPESASSDGE